MLLVFVAAIRFEIDGSSQGIYIASEPIEHENPQLMLDGIMRNIILF